MTHPFEIEYARVKPFWHYFPAFFAYFKQEKLFYLLMALSCASLHQVFSIILVTSLINLLLYLTAFKIAFEVLVSTSEGRLEPQEFTHIQTNDYMGVKVLAIPILQFLVYVFVAPQNPALALVSIIIMTLVVPAFLMILSRTNSLIESLNPIPLMTIIQRIGLEYYALTAVYLVFTLVPFLLKYVLLGQLPQWLEYVCFALINNFSLIWIFHVIGFVLYRHSELLGMNESDYEPEPLFPEDPIKDRIESLLESQQPQEALDMINSLQQEDGRGDLGYLKSQALDQLNQSQQLDENQQITLLIERGALMQALKQVNEMLEQQRIYRPELPQPLSILINYAQEKQQFNTVIKLIRGMADDYPEAHQMVVDHYFLMAKILYENKKKGTAITLLNRTISRYEKTANIKQLRAYLKGVHLKKP